MNQSIKFRYKNHRGEVSLRVATPQVVWWGTTRWHPDAQWIMTAFDHDKNAMRDFALKDCNFVITS